VSKTHRSSIRTGLTVKLPTDLDGLTVDPKLTRYSVELQTKILGRGGASHTYFDQARAVAIEFWSPPIYSVRSCVRPRAIRLPA
jgi:hypothetical protein